jgi:peptidoglycan/LPS O-acetylase OafA/YrhL
MTRIGGEGDRMPAYPAATGLRRVAGPSITTTLPRDQRNERPSGGAMTGRSVFYPEVEALRGIAALAVVVFHTLSVRGIDPHTFDAPTPDTIANYVLTTIFNGTGAVTLFFVISGFVLGCNVSPDTMLSGRFYAKFALRRVFRIMPALWVSLGLAAIIIALYHHQRVGAHELVRAALLGHEALRFNGPLWSLQVEMLVSAIYPLLLFANFRFGLAAQLVLLAGLSYMTYSGDPTEWTSFLFCFQLGIMVPSAGRRLIDVLGSRPAAVAALFAVAGVMVPTNISNLGYLRPTEHTLIEGFSSFVILSYIVFAERSRLATLLRAPAPRFLGRVSYSLYLLHLPIISLLINLALRQSGGVFDLSTQSTLFSLTIMPLALLLCLTAAWGNYVTIEVYFHNLGRRLTGSATLQTPRRESRRWRRRKFADEDQIAG